MTDGKEYAITVEETAKRLKTDLENGLPGEKAIELLAEYGRNEIVIKSRVSPWKILARQFKDIIILLLLIAAAVSFSIGDTVEGAAVIAVIMLTVFFGFITEYRAEKSVEELQKLITPTAKVMRDGEILEIDARELVPGDIMILEEGDRVTADGRIIESDDLAVNESMLTGESEPVSKHARVVRAGGNVPLGDRKNMVYMGTMVTGGNGRAIATGTGSNTQMGRISTMLQETEDESTPIEKQLATTGRFLIIITFVITAVIAVAGIISGVPVVEMLKTAIALAVAAVPEGLPAVATITLAVGMRRMAKKNALMKNLPAVETLGSTTIICTDKTGTLTENQMTVQEIYLPGAEGRMINVTGTGYKPEGGFLEDGKNLDAKGDEALSLFLTSGLLASNAVVTWDDKDGWKVIGDPTEGALITAASKAGFDDGADGTGYDRIDELPFDSDKKFMAVSAAKDGNSPVIFLKGAPGVIIGMCGYSGGREPLHELDEKKREKLLEVNSRMARKGLRILALAYKEGISADSDIEDEIGEGLVFLGFAGILDPPRPGISKAVAQARSAGIRVIMITGDQKDTAAAIAGQVGIGDEEEEVITGAELDEMSSDELADALRKSSVFARVSPGNKLNIVDALKKNNEVAAMTGDGVNDAPALKKADIGISMGLRGTSVANEASDMVLLDDSFGTIITAIRQGRVIFDNIQKFIHYLLSCNLSEIMLIFISIIIGVPAPLLAIQILWLNLVTDIFPAFALAWEAPEARTMERPPRDPGKPIITNSYKMRIVLQGFVIVLGPLFVYLIAMNLGYAIEESRTIGFMALALVQLFHVFNVRRKNGLGFDSTLFKSPYLWGAFLVTMGLQMVAVYVPFMQKVLKTTAMSPVMWLYVIAGAVAPIILIQLIALVRKLAGKPYRD
ncbi:MAG: cation-transporting P-type ATPase [Clostridia bacterium]|nr:cation-transporting P-type ATPase [Clostridia bacterium]